jgi:hypothetical protein
MKLEFLCWRWPEGTPGRRVTEPFNDSAVYRFTCARNHVHEILLMQLRFEVLAETAMQALVDGYYRDAVASFAAALERIYQLYAELVCRSKGMDQAAIEAAWKLVARQSERQLGMFIGLYQIENGAPPPLLAQRHVTFRNNVIHQGILPSEDEAIVFAQGVVDLVQPLLNAMMPRYTKEIEAVFEAHMTEAAAKGSADQHKSRVFFEFILQFDPDADDWDPAPANIRAELATRRARALK